MSPSPPAEVVPTPELQRAQREKVDSPALRKIHVGFALAIAAEAGLGWAMGPRLGLDIDPELRTWIVVFLAMSAGLHLLCLTLLKQVIAHMSGARYLNYCIVRWALAEGVALYGLVLAGVGMSPRWTAGFFVLAAWLWWDERPSKADHERFLNHFR